jgi:hypothetical protein
MRGLLAVILALCIAGTAGAVNFGNVQIVPDKDTYVGDNMGDGREGGETWASALPIPGLPYTDSGATCDNTDEITLPCAGSAAPEVVYSYTATSTMQINVSLCGSGYDTALGIYDSAQTNLFCNDDFCGLQSEIDNIPVTAGQTYYIVVDGYSTNCGSYVISVTGVQPCVVECPTGGLLENEPPCGDNYWDTWNGGCNSQGFQLICPEEGSNSAVMCGKSGTYSYYGSGYRDTDWFKVYAAGGNLTATVNAEFAVQLILFYVIDYNCYNYQYNYTSGPCGTDVSLSYSFGANTESWVWVGPSVFVGVPCESDYNLTVTGIMRGVDCGPVPTQNTSWGAIKNLYNK